jgi:hypothetical protein
MTRKSVSLSWYEETVLGDECCFDTHCAKCDPSGGCDSCDTVDGRFIGAVCEYASTCDWCHELTSHEHLAMDPDTQLGYCPTCIPLIPADIRSRIT